MSSAPDATARDREALAERIAAILETRPEVLEAYLFGSQATGRAHSQCWKRRCGGTSLSSSSSRTLSRASFKKSAP